jgi:hypothetical protein
VAPIYEAVLRPASNRLGAVAQGQTRHRTRWRHRHGALSQSTGGGSGAILVLADDGQRYWCKTLNNFQHERVPTNEQLAGHLGMLVGAPVSEPRLVFIPPDLETFEIRPGTGRFLEEGWAHGSVAAQPAVETRDLSDRSSDDNPQRHAGIYALYDWLGGSDAQWLVVGGERMYYSHDHGHYFPGGPGWTRETLAQAGNAAYALGHPAAGLDVDEVNRLADRIDGLSEEDIAGCASNLPADWPVLDEDLEALLDFLYARRAPVAERLRALLGAL